MKVVLASQGFTTDEIENEVALIVGKPAKDINIAIINESAYLIDKNKSKRWLINELANIEKHIGGRIDFIDFYMQSIDEIRQRLFNADLVYIVGGKQHVYSKIFNETNIIGLIKEVANKKVIMGTSAGSVVLGKPIESKIFWKKRYNCNLEDFEYEELGIVPFNIIPHYMREDHKQWTKKFLEDVLLDNPFPVYAITDKQAVAYIDGKIKFIGGTPEVFEKNTLKES